MYVVYSDRYYIDIGTHVYPTQKYRLVHERLAGRHFYGGRVEPTAACWDDLALVHTPEYLGKVRDGRLSVAELALLELPWSPQIVEGFRLMTGGTCTAAGLAVESRSVVVHLGGGFHHAFADHGEGFCLFNDTAVAIRLLQRRRVLRATVIDCDVHHGNGTAMIFGRDESVFTFSMHQQLNYPAFKPRSTMDIALSDGTNDDEYLEQLARALPQVFASPPDVAFYLAGADPYEGDQLGGLALTFEGLRRRDRMILQACAAAGVPVVVLLAGGYARRLDDTVAIHVGTVEEAYEVARRLAGDNQKGA